MQREIQLWDSPLASPAANLAADEALLDACEAGGPEVLRFWEPAEYFVVLGFSNAAAREVNLENCRRANIPVLRRCSGGGAVLQGPGCLNYTLILRLSEDNETHTIPAANRSIMERNGAALAKLLNKPVRVEGVSDLCLNGRKFSGNSQRRLRHALIFHGAFLLDFDLDRITEFLAMPSRQPDYRKGRLHHDFLTNLLVRSSAIKGALRQAWGADQMFGGVPDYASLVESKYSNASWNLKF